MASNRQIILVTILGGILLIEIVYNYLQMIKNSSLQEELKFAEMLEQERVHDAERDIKEREERIKACISEIESKTNRIKECNRRYKSKSNEVDRTPDETSEGQVSIKSHTDSQQLILRQQEITDECFFRRKELGTELSHCNNHSTEVVFRDQNFLDRIKSFVLFIGYARSGHSIVAALLDAHPHIAISHELHVVQLWDNSYRNDLFKTRIDLFQEIMDNTHKTTSDEHGFRSPNLTAKYYTLDVPGLSQGTYEDYIQIIGDKKAGGLVSVFKGSKKELSQLREFEKFVGYPLKFLHIVRNPFDNIATKFLYALSQQTRKEAATNETLRIKENDRLKKFTESHLRCYKEIPKYTNYFGENMLTLHHEDLVKNPKLFLTRICNFFEIYCPTEYLETASKSVFDSPTKSRFSVEWSREERNKVEKAIQEYNFLKRYSFDS